MYKRQIIEKPWATTGHKHKRPKNVVNSLHIEPDELEPLVVERYERYQKIQENETMVETEGTEDADIIIVAYGTMARVATVSYTHLDVYKRQIQYLSPVRW